MKTQPTEYHWCNDLSEFKCIMCRGRRNQNRDYMKQPLKFVSWDKQHTFSTSETTSHDSRIYCTRCEEHNRADEIIRITKPDEEINVQNKPMKTSVKLATSSYKKTEGGRLREGVLWRAYFMLASRHLHGRPGKNCTDISVR